MKTYRLLWIALMIQPFNLAYAADMEGSADHPMIPRVTESEILGYAYSDYDAGNLFVEEADSKVGVLHPEGSRTRILYVTPQGTTPLAIQKNYEVALNNIGDVVERYTCQGKSCSGHLISTTLWTRDTMIPTEGLKYGFYLLGFAQNFTRPSYRYARVTTDDALLHVGVLSAEIAPNNSNTEMRGRTVALLEVVEVKDFNATLEFIDAAAMQSEIDASGQVALYGIQFDHDKATLKPESTATLDEIAAVMRADSSLAIYVVGHTDDVGTLAYNEGLSLRRAQSVIDALVQDGIAAGRMTALGVGPAAPLGNNDTDQGRTLNRRVALVKRSDN